MEEKWVCVKEEDATNLELVGKCFKVTGESELFYTLAHEELSYSVNKKFCVEYKRNEESDFVS